MKKIISLFFVIFLVFGILQSFSQKVTYRAHISGQGWTDWLFDGQTAGTEGQGKKIEAIEISMEGCSVLYQVHIKDYGWSGWVKDGDTAGTTGKNLRLESIMIKTDEKCKYKIEYKVHVAQIGWLPWTSNSEAAGSIGQSRQIEAIKIRVVK